MLILPTSTRTHESPSDSQRPSLPQRKTTLSRDLSTKDEDEDDKTLPSITFTNHDDTNPSASSISYVDQAAALIPRRTKTLATLPLVADPIGDRCLKKRRRVLELSHDEITAKGRLQ